MLDIFASFWDQFKGVWAFLDPIWTVTECNPQSTGPVDQQSAETAAAGNWSFGGEVDTTSYTSVADDVDHGFHKEC